MLLNKLLQILETIAPFSLQETYDNAGLQVGLPGREVNRGLICLDVTPAVIREARQKGCDLVISHHPLIFEGIKQLTGARPAEQVIMEAIRQDVAIVSLHTNLDNVDTGVNHRLGSVLGLEHLRILAPRKGLLKKLVTFCPTAHAGNLRSALFRAGAGHIGDYDCCSFNLSGRGSFRAGENSQPFTGNVGELHFEEEERIETIFPVYLQQTLLEALHANHPYEEVAYDIYPLDNAFEKAGSGMLGKLPGPMPEKAFLAMVKERLGTPCLRHSPVMGQDVQKVAFCGGSGAFLLEQAIRSGAQAFITGDVKFHRFFDAAGSLLLVDAGHYETEQFTKELLLDLIKKKMINFALLVSETGTNPVNYY